MDKAFLDFLKFENSRQLPFQFEESLRYQLESTKTSLLSHSLRVTKDTVPFVDKQVGVCAKILGLKKSRIDTYIYSKPDYNAFSISQTNNSILVGISSSLVNILTDKELRFLIGHELGHAVYQHSESTHLAENIHEHDIIKILRNMEISADRIGYICTNSLEFSISSMMKTASGLDDRLLKTDIRPFIDQNVPLDSGNHLIQSTHPPLPLRARALVWLSTVRLFDSSGNPIPTGEQNLKAMNSVNNRIKADVSKYLDKAIEESFESAKNFFRLTLFTLHLAKTSVLTKKDQNMLIQECGEDAKKLFKLMNGMPHEKVQNMLTTKTRDTFREMSNCSVTRSNQFIEECSTTIGISSQEIHQLISTQMDSNTI